jgi:hypothetical protein
LAFKPKRVKQGIVKQNIKYRARPVGAKKSFKPTVKDQGPQRRNCDSNPERKNKIRERKVKETVHNTVRKQKLRAGSLSRKAGFGRKKSGEEVMDTNASRESEPITRSEGKIARKRRGIPPGFDLKGRVGLDRKAKLLRWNPVCSMKWKDRHSHQTLHACSRFAVFAHLK